MTRKQLERFVKTRNTSPHQSNLQFQIDADACGFKVSELGDPSKEPRPDTDYPETCFDYVWRTPIGALREHRGMLSIDEAKDARAA